jgi:hypothetical protein
MAEVWSLLKLCISGIGAHHVVLVAFEISYLYHGLLACKDILAQSQ